MRKFTPPPMIAHVVPDKPSAMRRSGKNPAPNNLRKAIRPCPEVVLLAVTGMSPAILTETVWALGAGKSAGPAGPYCCADNNRRQRAD
jgi:hypothetical protein